MKLHRFGRAAAILSVASLALVACGESNNPGGDDADAGTGGENGAETSEVQGTLSGGGSSAQEAAMTAWANGFTSVAPDAQVNYASVGSGSGREGFLGGEYDFAGSDAAMDEGEWEQSQEICGPDGAFHIPSYISPIAAAYNVEGIDGSLNLDAETLAGIFAGEITSWDDEAVAEHNPDVDLPDTPITVVHRADDSGTTENFTEYLEAAAPEVWEWEADGSWPADVSSESAQQTSGVVDLTTQTDGAITYADASQIGDLDSVAVEVGEEYVEYSPEAAAQAVASSTPVEGQAPNNMSYELDRDTEESGAYPIVLVAYNIFCNEYQDQETVDLVQAFGEYVVSEDGQSTAESAAGNAPMSDELRDEALEAIDQIRVTE
ncbi:phosphate ABC transporter substrate-binding protein PstS [Nesterenkonia sp. HG001]|uniref:phosphate ABC transporter substrate-binding protein PstS n=1 Tax=Nesterenkonia sp. HG001 TaxID=2983207 RepID=UPI002AC4D8C7|nr:phosphate ABC transporter substrate-binding protein PstS [Nesterenkonia sp. HG001]MDZ5078170.1 phosphate ABC transporter substrate-binding protein PstS [Nesterenkonia sp. HG001]